MPFKRLIVKLLGVKMSNSDFANIRAHYREPSELFDVEHLASLDPIKQFDNWFKEVRASDKIKEANVMCLATSSKSGKPSSRMVLLKGYSEEGFKFFTNYHSRKGEELEENPYVALCFYWDAFARQVRIEGHVEKISQEESVEYFNSRPLNSRISAYVSDQSKVIKNREVLVDAHAKVTEMLCEKGNDTVPMPEHWGGYLVIPDVIEFWHGNNYRLHDRLRFRKPSKGDDVENNSLITKGENGWVIERLAP